MQSAHRIIGVTVLTALLVQGGTLFGVQNHIIRRHVTAPPPIQTTGLTINPGFILTMYNVAVQTPNKIVNNLPPDLLKWASFVNIAVTNTGPVSVTPFWHLTVETNGCQAITYSGGDTGVAAPAATLTGPSAFWLSEHEVLLVLRLEPVGNRVRYLLTRR